MSSSAIGERGVNVGPWRSRIDRRLVACALACLSSAWASLAAQPPAPRASGAGRACVQEESRRAVVLPDGRPVFVEPTVFVPGERGTLLAGTHNYVFGRTAAGDYDLDAVDSLFGVVVDDAGRAIGVPAPIRGDRIFGARAVARGGGGWAVVFAEGDTTAHFADRVAQRYWFGIFDGTAWRGLRTLPPVSDGVLRAAAASELVSSEGRLALAVPVRRVGRPDGVAIYRSGGDAWTVDALDTWRSSYVTLAPRVGGGLLLGVVRPDTTLPVDANSFFLYEWDGAWRADGRIILGGAADIHFPTLLDGGVAVGWMVRVASRGTYVPRVMTGVLAPATRRTATFDMPSRQFLAAATRGEGTLWVANGQGDGGGPRQLLFVGAHRGEIVALDSAANPFTGLIGAAFRDSALTIAGPVVSYQPAQPRLSSMLLRLRVRCGMKR